MPDDGEVAGLPTLMLLTEARRTARVSAGGELVTLVEQNRGAWDAGLIAEGHRLVRERLAANVAPGRYQILAAISAVRTSARDVRDTGWSQVVALYDQLVRLDPSPIIALNRAIAVAELDGPEVALAAVDRLEDKLAGYHLYHATRADLLHHKLLAEGLEDQGVITGQKVEWAKGQLGVMGFYVGVEGHIKFDDGTQGTFSSKGLDTSKVGDLDVGTIVPVRYDADQGGAGRRRRRRPGEGE